MIRREDENYLSYVRRVTDACANKTISYTEWGDYVLGVDNTYSSDNLRKAFYVVCKMLKGFTNDCLSDDDAVKEIELLRDELYKERCKLQDANREKRNNLRIEARFENILEVLSGIIPEIEINDYKPINKNTERKTAILQLSDWHCGTLIDNQFNYYDVDTMVERATIIRDKAISHCKTHDVTDLVVEINGDMVDGAIHVSTRVAQEESVVEQCMTVVDVLAKLINSMKPYFNSIKVVTTLGNHGRLTPNKSDSTTRENFEMIIPWGLRKELKDVTVIDSKGLDFVQYKVDDKTIVLAHGQNDKLAKAVDDYAKMYKEIPSEVHLGHTHSYKDINDCDCIVTVNGCLDGSDDYALSIRKVTKPSQNLIVYDGDRCIYNLIAE
jgi:uncharacterized protein YnzC (UPF0291/DUF896 family)